MRFFTQTRAGRLASAPRAGWRHSDALEFFSLRLKNRLLRLSPLIAFRHSWPDEWERAVRVCPDPFCADRCFLAIQDEPVERIVGASFWRFVEAPGKAGEGTPVAPLAEFTWRVLPHYAGTEAELAFLGALRRDVATRSQARLLKTRGVFFADSAVARVLGNAGFHEHSTNIVFEGSQAVAAERHARMRRTFGQADSSSLTLTVPDASHAEALKQLIGQREGLLSAEEIEHALAQPLSNGRAFDPEWSSVLLELPSRRVIGAQLIRFEDGAMTVPAAAIEAGTRHLPGLGWYLMLGRWLGLCEVRGWTGAFHCKVNPSTNPTMLRMAGLFGYREIGRKHTYAIGVGDPVPAGAFS
jgi:hypothetical protein